MTKEEFMATLRAWREKYPEGPARTAAYLSAIPKQVQASMAFEGDYVDLKWLEDNLTPLTGIESDDHLGSDQFNNFSFSQFFL